MLVAVALASVGAAGTVANEYNEAAWLTKTRGVEGAEVAYGYHPAGQVSNVVTVAGAEKDGVVAEVLR